MYRIGIDVGGTFTDCVLLDERTGETVTHKTPTADGLIAGIGDAFERVFERGDVTAGDVRSVSHGSTVAVNALIEETGARTALLTTDGFGDVLEIGRGNRDESLLYSPCGEYRPPLIPRRRRYTVDERVAADGTVETPLDEDELRDLAAELVADDVEAVAVCFLHSYRNDVHERRAARVLADAAPSIAVSVSADVAPVIREYRRMATTVVDAYLKPVVSEYLADLTDEIRTGAGGPPVRIMKSDGGVARPAIVARRPSTQLISGPVAAVNCCEWLGDRLGFHRLITMDMGGTSCDVAIVEDGSAREVRDRELRGMRIRGPFVDVRTVGSGGGSIAGLDEVGALRVGPESAGARPGPICYGRGGTEPTVTDADLVLGRLRPEGFAGGEFDLDAGAARRGVRERIAGPLDVSVEEAAASIRTLVDSQMAAAVRRVAIENGEDPRECSLVAFGGAGPMHACDVATELGVDAVCFPATAGLLSATGVASSDVRHDYVRSVLATLPGVDVAELRRVVESLGGQASDDLDDEGVDEEDRRFEVSLEMRYEGQSHNLDVAVASARGSVEALRAAIADDVVERVAGRFEDAHERAYGFVDDENPARVVSLTLTATGDVDPPPLGRDRRDAALADARRDEREVVLEPDRTETVPFYRWRDLPTDRAVDGPAVVEADHTTAWRGPAVSGRVVAHGNLLAERRPGRD